MIGLQNCLRVAASSTILMMTLGESYGRELTIGGVVSRSAVDISGEDSTEGMEQQLGWLCSDDPYLKYLHFNANLGTTSFKDCTWVAESPTDRCMLQASHSGRSEIGSTEGALLLQDVCRLSCGMCPTDLVDPETDLDREGNLMTDDLTLEEIKELEIRLRRKKQNLKMKRKGRKPCPCPDGQHDGTGDDTDINGGNGTRDDENTAPQPQSQPSQAPRPFTAPIEPLTDVPTSYPTFADTQAPTNAGTQQVTAELTDGYTSGYTSEYTSGYTSEYTSMYTSEYTSEFATDNAAVIGAVISGQQSSLNSNGSSRRRKIVITVSTIIVLLLVVALCCCIRKRRRSGKEDSDTDESDGVAYPIHKIKSADASASSDESRLKKVLKHFNGRQNDSRTDVHVCTSAICDVCDNRSPRRVMSVDSYKDEFAMSKLEAGDKRYRIREVEC